MHVYKLKVTLHQFRDMIELGKPWARLRVFFNFYNLRSSFDIFWPNWVMWSPWLLSAKVFSVFDRHSVYTSFAYVHQCDLFCESPTENIDRATSHWSFQAIICILSLQYKCFTCNGTATDSIIYSATCLFLVSSEIHSQARVTLVF